MLQKIYISNKVLYFLLFETMYPGFQTNIKKCFLNNKSAY